MADSDGSNGANVAGMQRDRKKHRSEEPSYVSPPASLTQTALWNDPTIVKRPWNELSVKTQKQLSICCDSAEYVGLLRKLATPVNDQLTEVFIPSARQAATANFAAVWRPLRECTNRWQLGFSNIHLSVIATESTFQQLKDRLVDAPRIVHLTVDLWGLASSALPLVRGESGGGKTMAVVIAGNGLAPYASATRKVIYLTASDLSLASVGMPASVEERNATVVAVVVKAVSALVGNVIVVPGSEVLLVVDEMGEYPSA